MKLGFNIKEERAWLKTLTKAEYIMVMQQNFCQRVFEDDSGKEHHVTFQISSEVFEAMYNRLHGITH